MPATWATEWHTGRKNSGPPSNLVREQTQPALTYSDSLHPHMAQSHTVTTPSHGTASHCHYTLTRHNLTLSLHPHTVHSALTYFEACTSTLLHYSFHCYTTPHTAHCHYTLICHYTLTLHSLTLSLHPHTLQPHTVTTPSHCYTSITSHPSHYD